jgi:hypothetical protein
MYAWEPNKNCFGEGPQNPQKMLQGPPNKQHKTIPTTPGDLTLGLARPQKTRLWGPSAVAPRTQSTPAPKTLPFLGPFSVPQTLVLGALFGPQMRSKMKVTSQPSFWGPSRAPKTTFWGPYAVAPKTTKTRFWGLHQEATHEGITTSQRP